MDVSDGTTGGLDRIGPLPVHAMDVGDIVDGAFRLYRLNLRTILTVVAITAGPLQLISAAVHRGDFQGNSLVTAFSNGISTTAAGSSNRGLSFLLAAAVDLIALPLSAGAVCRIVAASYLGESVTPAEALKSAGGRLVALSVAWLCVHVIEIIGFVLVVLPGFLFEAMFVAVTPAIMLERLGPFAGIGRSSNLTSGRIWLTLGRALLCGLASLAVVYAIALPFQLVAYLIGLRWGFLLLFVGNLLTTMTGAALSATTATLIYFDARIRDEGLDLQLLAGSIR